MDWLSYIYIIRIIIAGLPIVNRILAIIRPLQCQFAIAPQGTGITDSPSLIVTLKTLSGEVDVQSAYIAVFSSVFDFPNGKTTDKTLFNLVGNYKKNDHRCENVGLRSEFNKNFVHFTVKLQSGKTVIFRHILRE